MKKDNKVAFILLGLIVFGIIYLVISLTQNVGKTTSTVDKENAAKRLNELSKEINIREADVKRGSSISSAEEQTAILPDIADYPFVVNPTTDSFITIYSSTEKANEDKESWLCEVAQRFNDNHVTIDGVEVSVGVRSIPSNMAADFIISEKYTPEVYMPSSSIYGLMFDAKEKKYEVETENLVSNVSGIVISKKVKEEIVSKHNAADAETIINSVLDGECIVGYTNPLSNEDGLNYLLTLLSVFDDKSPFSDVSIGKLESYQDKIPYVSYDITQLEDSLAVGTIDGFVSNYQNYYLTPALRNNYDFIPFGMVQENPVYKIGELTQIKQDTLSRFVEFCKSDESQRKAQDKGFNAYSDYEYTGFKFVGSDVTDAQSLWKKVKNGTNDLTAIFVADVSGSMEGSPLLKLKASLNRASTFIDENTNIGLVTFSDDVNIVLPIGKFDTAQRSYFMNAVKSMRASGGTAMFDAIIVAEKLLVEAQEANPNTRLMLFVLTDGESNRGYEFKDIEKVSRDLRIPIYTIGYNADIDVLKLVSDINEASTMDADSDNVIYKLEDLFNAQM